MSLIIKCITFLACIIAMVMHVSASEFEISTEHNNSDMKLTYGYKRSVYFSHALSYYQLKCLIPSYDYFIFNSYFATADMVDPQFALSMQSVNQIRKEYSNVLVEATFRPCLGILCKPVEQQLQAVYEHVSHIPDFMIWLDFTGDWSEYRKNQRALISLDKKARELRMRIGIRTNKSDWKSLMNSSTAFSGFPLWFTRTKSRFSPFGGWDDEMLMFKIESTSTCGASTIVNVRNCVYMDI